MDFMMVLDQLGLIGVSGAFDDRRRKWIFTSADSRIG